MGNGRQIRFWLDWWVDQKPLKDLFPNLYAIVKDKGCTIENSLIMWCGNYKWFWNWKRNPNTPIEHAEYVDLINLVANPIISQHEDKWVWVNDASEIFSVASMKNFLFKARNNTTPFTMEWNSWIPKKLNIFMWQAEQERIQTRVGLSIRHVQIDSTNCAICDVLPESANHLLCDCDRVLVSGMAPCSSYSSSIEVAGTSYSDGSSAVTTSRPASPLPPPLQPVKISPPEVVLISYRKNVMFGFLIGLAGMAGDGEGCS
ncbi:hypothetical protein QVD17_19328 [Tagetes erecta]|uniref:Reverse transcriptase zinc-binding domain-containing protein n=1 Tax=Tagetes erecta TaxID=13708 RepID=A0AAD8KPI4_TARER|nr:hypothetical protein QVD17_19328 [Tagetes erecta]